MNLRMKWNRFTRTASIADMRTDALTQKLADLRKRAAAYYYRSGAARLGPASFAIA